MMQPKQRSTAAALLALLAAGAAAAQAGPVVLDGSWDEWRGTPGIIDPADAPAPYADVRSASVRHDADAVYLSLGVERPVALQGMPGTLVLLLDTDDDPRTGWTLHGKRGIEAAIEFSGRPRRGGSRAGVWLRTAPDSVVPANVAGVAAAPSHAATWFEIRIPRGGPVPLGRRMGIRFLSLDAEDRVVDDSGLFGPDLGEPAPRPTPPGHGASDPLARAPGTDFRVVSWNVGREDMFRQPDGFGALLRPLAPDLLLLDEVAGGHSAEEVEALLNRVLPGDRPWRAVYGVSGGSQRGVVATRGSAPRTVAPFDRELPHPDSARALAPATDPWLRDRLWSRVPATGAVVEVGGRRLFAVTVDLEAAGTPGSPRDRLRRMEALVIHEAAREAFFTSLRPAGVDGILLAGDLNLVGTREPLDILTAPAGDGPAFSVAQPLRLDGTSTATWENAVEPFTPTRLDFVLYHPRALEVAGGFVFRAADLSPEWRARHGLTADASLVTDHLPVVTDFRWVDCGR
jgi:Endonuclease/Exonuclease/phosphatase family